MLTLKCWGRHILFSGLSFILYQIQPVVADLDIHKSFRQDQWVAKLKSNKVSIWGKQRWKDEVGNQVYIFTLVWWKERVVERGFFYFKIWHFVGVFNVLILDASCAFQCVILWHHCFDQSTAFFRFDKYEGFVKITPCFLHSGLHLLYLFQRLCEFFITRWPKIIHSKTETCVHVINTAVAGI